MAGLNAFLFFIPFLSLSSDFALLRCTAQLMPILDSGHGQLQTYIIHVEKPDRAELLGDEDLETWHRSFLPNDTLASGAPRLLYSYRHVVSGFAARLTPEEVRAMEAKRGFVRAQRDKIYHLQTTYTPELLGLSQPLDGAWGKTMYGEGVIIGVVDSGIFPTHPSFHDKGMPPRPLKWKATCNITGFRCNNKIIGARGFVNGANASAIDNDGHGTHVASTAGGSFVSNAQVLGMAKGTASGMAPKSHLSIYKVCAPGCAGSDMHAGIEQAIKDGVDVLSLSLPGSPDTKFYDDFVAKSSLAAIRHGISPCAAAGNDGPDENTLFQSAPWVLTVGASSTDRRISAVVKLGNGTEIHGESAYQPYDFNSSVMLPLEYPARFGDPEAIYCLNGTLDNIDVRGKIVMCWAGTTSNIEKGEVVYAAGGAALILMNPALVGATTSSEAHVLPASHVTYLDGEKIQAYFYSSATPTATIIFNGTRLNHRPSPTVATFSSRGPSEMNGDIVKPDVLAPGVNILGAWPLDVAPYPSPFATKTFNFETGTSMATPHVSGIVALVKYRHRDWSPAAIQSAIITSAKDQDDDGNSILDDVGDGPAGIYATGAGQVSPARALDPGMVYDLTYEDYIGYLCGLGYNDTEVSWTASEPVQCSSVNAISPSQLNYPSIAVSFKIGTSATTQTVRRTATNVGEASEVYRVRITEPKGVKVYLSTYELRFARIKQQQNYYVTLVLQKSPGKKGLVSRGKIEWYSDKHSVTSPIAVRFT